MISIAASSEKVMADMTAICVSNVFPKRRKNKNELITKFGAVIYFILSFEVFKVVNVIDHFSD